MNVVNSELNIFEGNVEHDLDALIDGITNIIENYLIRRVRLCLALFIRSRYVKILWGISIWWNSSWTKNDL